MTKLTERIIAVVFVASTILYLAQAFTPLRLDTDGITYLSLSDQAASNGFIAAMRQPDFPFPKGYPVFLFILMKLHVFSSAALVLSNFFFFCTALLFTLFTLERVGFSRLQSAGACLLTLLSFAAVKHVTQARSDFLFYALAACSCWLMALPDRRKWLALPVSVLGAIEVRLLGLALLAPIALQLWEQIRDKRLLRTAVAIGVAAFALAGGFAGHRYFSLSGTILQHLGFWPLLIRDVVDHTYDFAELALNVPFSKLPANFQALAWIVGSLSIVLLGFGIQHLWDKSRWLCCYLIASACIILPWPFSDPRFWLPVLPLVFLTALAGLERLVRKPQSRVVAAYAGLFCIAGFLALGYSTRLTFSGPEFASRYGDGRLTKTYAAGCLASDPDPEIENAARLLQRYEWHCGKQGSLAALFPSSENK